ncbi:hypothetical protein [Aliidiomarina quisquiliarum]|uniref:hypothetical protein n=1 Tax=Aliidiomarina quisquiliarum TaxID=2938947 RepID=UPI00208FF6DE|nr:hypothetical protein [Aliidiomarina quisquiliarum]MCO4321357.1 hypothetical protein [Aliidiomarina quisquiliarum]
MLYAPPPERQANTKHEMTELEATKLALQRERAIRSLISEFAADFMASSSADFNAAINRVLARSGKYMKADRTYVF